MQRRHFQAVFGLIETKDRAVFEKAPGYLRKVSRKSLNLSFDDDAEKKKEVLCALCVGNSCEL